MNILLTGGAGFIGGALLRKLIKNGHNVCMIDNMEFGKDEQINTLLQNENFIFLKKDIRYFLKKDLKDFDPEVLIHFAAYLGVKEASENPLKVIDVEYMGTKNILKQLESFKLKKIIFASTSEIYGESPLKGSNELDYVSPQTPYSVSKLLAEYEVRFYAENKNINWTSCRFFNIYGPSQDIRFVIPKFIQWARNDLNIKIIGDGKHGRTFMYIDDCILILEKIICSNKSEEILNIGSDEYLTINNLAKIIIERINSNSKIKYYESNKLGRNKKYEIYRRKPDLSKMSKLFDLENLTSFSEGLNSILNIK